MNLSFEQRHAAGMRLTPMGGGGGGGSSAAQNYTAMMQAALSREQLDWAKQIYADEAPQRDTATRLGNDISQAQLEQMRTQTEIARQAQEDYTNTYRPLEQSLVKEAQEYDTPERRAAEAAAATSDVERNVAAQRGATMREMERAGVNPASGKVMALQGGMDIAAARAKAGAANQASKAVETIGYARKSDAVNLGRGIASSQATNAAMASSMGSAAMGTQQQAMATRQASNQGLSQGYAAAQQGLSGAGSQFGSIGAQQAAAQQSRSSSTAAGIGAIASVAALAFM